MSWQMPPGEIVYGAAKEGKWRWMRDAFAKDWWKNQLAFVVSYSTSYSGYTPLHIASSNGHLQCVKILIEAGADVNSKNIFEKTPLHYASIKNNASIVSILLEKGANVDAVSDENTTSLMMAAQCGHLEVVKLLLVAGANRELKNNYGWSALFLANFNKHYEVVNIITGVDSAEP